MPSGRTAMYSPEGIFPLGITHSSRPAAKLGTVRSGWPISCSETKTSLNVPSAYSPEGIFPLGITHSSWPAAKLNKKVFRPERTVCVQSRKRFFTPEQPIHPGLSRNFGRSGRISGLGYQKMTHDVLLCTVTRLFCYPKPLLHPGLSRNCGEATTRRSRNYVSGPGT